MYQQFLKCFPDEGHLLDIFEYIRLSADDILELTNPPELSEDTEDHPLDSIAVGVLETRSFLFVYEDDEDKENKKRSKVQRSHSDRTSAATATKNNKGKETLKNNVNKEMPAKPKCPKIDALSRSDSVPERKKVQNKFLQNIKKGQDDSIVPPIQTEKKNAGPRNPDAKPRKAALVNAKYVTYTRITNDLSVMFFTSADTTLRRFYLINCVIHYVETLGIALNQLGINTDSIKMSLTKFVLEFQTHILYGFMVGVLVAMANTNPSELNDMIKESNHEGKMEVDGVLKEPVEGGDTSNRYIPLTQQRREFLLDLMRDVASYVESKDFELGLPITNFTRYHELWSMLDEAAVSEDED